MSTCEEFEKWAESVGHRCTRWHDTNDYVMPAAQLGFDAWQAATAQCDAEIAQLKAEVERTQSHLAHTIESRDATFRANESLKAELAQLKAERDALLKDAERYRKLRRKVCIVGGKFHILNLAPTHIATKVDVELDAVIDAAMASSSKEGK